MAYPSEFYLRKYSIGVGDRFGHQGAAQLAAVQKAVDLGVYVTPVWNKSFREHQIIGTTPQDQRHAADQAVIEFGWQDAYCVDADHINLNNVDEFLDHCDFFTIDVADVIGQQADREKLDKVIRRQSRLTGPLVLVADRPAIDISRDVISQAALKYVHAIDTADRIYQYIREHKSGSFLVEISMDETDQPQTPAELLLILEGLAAAGIPCRTIAPRFSGRFNKGVEYVGDITRFAQEFESDVAVIQYAVKAFGLPDTLKLSVHSGSDKFSLYPIMRVILQNWDAGVHLKTAGTTWLEECIGLAVADEAGAALLKEIYAQAYEQRDDLMAPYREVLDIDIGKLPLPREIARLSGQAFANSITHRQAEALYNRHMRQLMHVAYKLAAEKRELFLPGLERCRAIVSQRVTDNLFTNHLKPLFIG